MDNNQTKEIVSIAIRIVLDILAVLLLFAFPSSLVGEALHAVSIIVLPFVVVALTFSLGWTLCRRHMEKIAAEKRARRRNIIVELERTVEDMAHSIANLRMDLAKQEELNDNLSDELELAQSRMKMLSDRAAREEKELLSTIDN